MAAKGSSILQLVKKDPTRNTVEVCKIPNDLESQMQVLQKNLQRKVT